MSERAIEMLAEAWGRLRVSQRATEIMRRGRGDDPKPVREMVDTKIAYRSYSDEPGEGLADFMEWLNGCVESVPAELRGSIRVDLTTESDCDETHGALEIAYTRPETAEEVMERQAAWAARDASTEQREREEFEALKSKFEPRKGQKREAPRP